MTRTLFQRSHWYSFCTGPKQCSGSVVQKVFVTLDNCFSQQTIKCTDISVTASGRQAVRGGTLMMLVVQDLDRKCGQSEKRKMEIEAAEMYFLLAAERRREFRTFILLLFYPATSFVCLNATVFCVFTDWFCKEITKRSHAEEWCVVVCDAETWPWAALGCCARERKRGREKERNHKMK